MYATTTRIPEAFTGDSPELAEALEIARALWDSGEKSDAVRWLRRAMDAADEAGDLARVATLARAAAELAEVSAPSRPAPSIAPHSQTRLTSRATELPMPRSATPPPLPSARAHKPVLKPAPKPTLLPPVSSPPTLRPARNVAPPPRPMPVQEQDPLRIRVSVQVSVRDPNLLVVRRLAQGKALPPGTREAFLMMTETVDATDTLEVTALEIEAGAVDGSGA